GSNAVSLGMASVSSDAPAMTADYSIEVEEVDGALDPSVDIDEDGTPEVSHSGLLTSGQTESATIDPTLSDDSWSVSGSGSPVTVSADITEATVTSDPAVELNGQTVSHTGTLADGESVSKTLPADALQSGTNRVNVSVGDGTLSSDAPDPSVGLELSHDATDKQTVDYAGEAWSERYNVSRTYGSATENPTLTIPFDGKVVEIESVELRRNGGSWKAAGNWVHDSTTLTVEFDDVENGDTLEIRATGRKVRTENGDIQVTEPTIEGDTLNTEIEITERQEDFVIDVSGTAASDRIHYTADESWESSSFVAVDANGGQELRLPDVVDGSTTRVRTAPLEVDPQSGSAEVVVYDADEPQFHIRPGESEGDLVDVGWMDAASEVTYDLVDDDGNPVDTSTANSPVWFTTSDEAATYTIVESSDSSGPDVLGPTDTSGGTDAPPWILLLSVAGALGLLMLVSRRVGSDSSGSGRFGRGTLLFAIGAVVVAIVAAELVTAQPLPAVVIAALSEAAASLAGPLVTLTVGLGLLVALWQVDVRTRADVPRWLLIPGAGLVVVFAIETISPGAILGPISSGFETVAPVVLLTAAAGGVFLIREWLRARRAEATTPDTQLSVDLGSLRRRSSNDDDGRR
ncbi:hypothetical protein ACFSBX_14485, partial [Halobellus rarus]